MNNEQPLMLSRNMYKLFLINKFCDKYNLNKKSIINDDESLFNIIKDICQIMIIRNEFKRPLSHLTESYNKYNILFNNKIIALGYFTDDEVNDINNLDVRISIKEMKQIE